MFVNVKCPYCGNSNTVKIDCAVWFSRIVTCDIDDSDGCDANFVIKGHLIPEIKTYCLVEHKEGANQRA